MNRVKLQAFQLYWIVQIEGGEEEEESTTNQVDHLYYKKRQARYTTFANKYIFKWFSIGE